METKNIIWIGVAVIVMILVATATIYFTRGNVSPEVNNATSIPLVPSNNTSPPTNNSSGPLSPLAINRTASVAKNNTSPFVNKTKVNNSSTSTNNNSYPVVAPQNIGVKKTWCNYGETWTSSKIPGKTLLKQSFISLDDEILCIVSLGDKSEEYAFTEGEIKVYRVTNPGEKAAPILELIS